MLRHTVTLTVPAAVTGWKQIETDRTIALKRVHLQRLRTVSETVMDMDARPVATLWIDARVSLPKGMNYIALQREAEAAGDTLRVTHDGNVYRVMTVAELPGDRGDVHHWELELI